MTDNSDIGSEFETLLAAFSLFLGNNKEVNAKKALQAYLMPLLKTQRDETAEALEILQERIEDLEEESINGKADKLVTDAKTVIENLYNTLNLLMLKHDYIADGNYTDKADETLKAQHLASQVAMVSWFTAFKAYEEASSDDDEDDDDPEENDNAEPMSEEQAA